MYHASRFTLEKIKRRLKLVEPLVYAGRSRVPDFYYRELAGTGKTPLTGKTVDLSGWERIPPEAYWGPPQTSFILRSTVQLPEGWDSAVPTALFLPLGDAGDFSHPEALLYLDGEPYAACDRHHQEVLLPSRVLDGKAHTLALHGWTGLGGGLTGDLHTRLKMRPCEIVQLHEDTRQLQILTRLALETAEQLDSDNPIRANLTNALDAAFLALDLQEPFGRRFYASVPAALGRLKAGIESAGPALEPVVHAAGHAHIDVAWLWTLGQTRQKAARTFHTVLRYMEQFPGYRFTQSQPQLYEFIRQDFPELFEQIRDRVSEGRWELTGGMWVEADCNISGAEALARQFLLGRNYFREHFGEKSDTPILWLPDVFGYAWALPQLIRQAGLDYFMTIKISWNQYNRMPYDTFWWQGLDGTRVLTHFSTTPTPGSEHGITYNAMADPQALLGTWRKFKQKELQRDLLMAYGYGDGGGGPTREMLENLEQMEAFPGLPEVRFSSVGDFFEQLSQEIDARVPVWNGELYLEYHRGTYTTQARSKRANRKAEFALHDAEFLCSIAAIETGDPYPLEDLTTLWRTLCLNQFHDILPGSSIQQVYSESLEQYAGLFKTALTLREAALESLCRHTGAGVLAVNPSPFPQEEPFLVAEPIDEAFSALATQKVASGVLVQPATPLPPYSIQSLEYPAGIPPAVEFPVEAYQEGERIVMENRFLRAELDSSGDLVRIYDKQADREVLAEGAVANRFQAFEDRPLEWDAWDIDIFYEDKSWDAIPANNIEIVENGPLRAAITIRRKILKSGYAQTISLDHNRPILTFNTEIDWQEKHTLLKVAFPVNVLAPQATYEIQWGSVQRPTHRNTSWDWARFETCAQKWVDLSEGNYGVSLINDCKYGHDVHDNTIRITLLRAPTWPDPEADQGRHTFTYQLFPHTGALDERTHAAAYALNDPVLVHRQAGESTGPTDSAPSPLQLVQADAPNAVIETVKLAEDGDGLIVRLFESLRQRSPVTLTFNRTIEKAWETNLLEENQSALETAENRITVSLRPFQIMTLRVRFAG